ncbi:hypothetical protein DITRI_Ditri03aG0168700 [Diplodiscus trichospermus]
MEIVEEPKPDTIRKALLVINCKEPKPDTMRKALLVINCILLSIGCGGPLIMRLYFLHGGKRVWSGWPIILFPIGCAYMHRSRTISPSQNKLFYTKPPLFIAAAVIGVLTGLDNYLYAYGVARLPV